MNWRAECPEARNIPPLEFGLPFSSDANTSINIAPSELASALLFPHLRFERNIRKRSFSCPFQSAAMIFPRSASDISFFSYTSSFTARSASTAVPGPTAKIVELLPRGHPFQNPSLRVFKACSVASVMQSAGLTSDKTFSNSYAILRQRSVMSAS